MRGLIFDLQRYSTHDGPGIRTTVFFKGCPLRCFWCHNPESIKPRPELMFTRSKCIGCVRCVGACVHGAMVSSVDAKPYSKTCVGACAHEAMELSQIEDNNVSKQNHPALSIINSAMCRACGECVGVCPSNALQMSGKYVTLEDLLTEAEKDGAFYRRSSGGVTVSGGEPLLQPEFAVAFLAACIERGWHTAVDTAEDVPFDAFEMVLPYTNLFLFDLKTADNEKHRLGCGSGSGRILANLNRLSAAGAAIRIRIPVIPGYNDGDSDIMEAGEVIKNLPNVHPVDLLRFHRMGSVKYDGLRQAYKAAELTPPSDERMRRLVEILSPYCGGEVTVN
jgi:pyruvate formate lyase activating enzyme